jgi:hypothetical protein
MGRRIIDKNSAVITNETSVKHEPMSSFVMQTDCIKITFATVAITDTNGHRVTRKKPEVSDLQNTRYLRNKTAVHAGTVIQTEHLFRQC